MFRDNDLRDVLLSSGLIIAAYPPSPFGFLLLFAFISQISMYRRNEPWHSFRLGYLAGLLVNLVLLGWIALYNFTGYSLIVLLNPLQFALFGWLSSFFFRRYPRYALLMVAFLWPLLEYLRQFTDAGFNWLNGAQALAGFPALRGLAAISGESAIILWTMLVNISLLLIIERKNQRKIYTAGLIVLFLMPVMFSLQRDDHVAVSKSLRVVVIQPNIDPVLKWQPETYAEQLQVWRELVVLASRDSVDLIVLPETAIPDPAWAGGAMIDTLQAIASHFAVTIATGFERTSDSGRRYNSVAWINPEFGEDKIYDKLRLVPFVEGIPFQNDASILADWNSTWDLLETGRPVAVVPVATQSGGEVSTSAVICYESAFSGLFRQSVQRGSQLVMVVTNDGWFGYSNQPYQHLRLSQLRAAENGIPVIHCANNGPSAIIDAGGHVIAQSHIFSREVIRATVEISSPGGLFHRYGDWLGWVSGIILLLLVILPPGKQRQMRMAND